MKKNTFFFAVVFSFVSIGAGAQDTTHKEIVGKYKFPAGSVVEEVTVAQENGAFSMSSSVGTSALEIIKGDTFNLVSFNGIAVFQRSAVKKVIGVHIDAGGYVLDGVKDSTAGTIVFTAQRKAQGTTSNTLDEVSLQIIKNEIALRRNNNHIVIEGTKNKE